MPAQAPGGGTSTNPFVNNFQPNNHKDIYHWDMLDFEGPEFEQAMVGGVGGGGFMTLTGVGVEGGLGDPMEGWIVNGGG